MLQAVRQFLVVSLCACCLCLYLLARLHRVQTYHECRPHLYADIPDAATMQVWWYIAGAVGGNLYKHDLASDSVVELEDARKEPPVSAMHHDAQGHVWVGHKGGMVRVWSERDLTPVTLPIKCFHAEIR